MTFMILFYGFLFGAILQSAKLNRYDKGWTQRILTDYYNTSQWVPSYRKKKQSAKRK